MKCCSVSVAHVLRWFRQSVVCVCNERISWSSALCRCIWAAQLALQRCVRGSGSQLVFIRSRAVRPCKFHDLSFSHTVSPIAWRISAACQLSAASVYFDFSRSLLFSFLLYSVSEGLQSVSLWAAEFPPSHRTLLEVLGTKWLCSGSSSAPVWFDLFAVNGRWDSHLHPTFHTHAFHLWGMKWSSSSVNGL